MDDIMRYRAVMQEVRKGTDQSVFDAMKQLHVTFEQMDKRLREYGDSVIADLINNKKFAVALAAYQQGYRHAPSAAGNEIHVLSARIGHPGAAAFGHALLEAGADLGVSDRRGMNGLYAMIFAVMIPANRNEENKAFLHACIQSASRQAVYAKNKAGVSAWDLIHAHGTEEMIDLVERIHG